MICFLAFMTVVPYMTVFVIDNKLKLQKTIKVLLSSAVVFSIFGLFQFVGGMFGLPNAITGLSERYDKLVLGFPRIQSTFIEPLYFANYLMVPIMVALFFLMKKVEKKKSWYFVLLFLLFIGVMVLTISKGAIASLAVVLVLIFIFQIRSIFSRTNIPYLLGIITFLVIVTGGMYAVLQSSIDFEKNYKKVYDVLTGGSITERQEAYDVALEAFNDNKLIGIGVGNFGPYFAGYPTSAPDYGWAIVNNQYLEILAELGLTGFMVFFIFILSIFYYSWKAYKKTKDLFLRTTLLALNFAFIGIMIQYLTFSTLYIMHIWVLIGLILATQQIVFKQSSKISN
ncbi:MAG TPA: O-antigen ligase family protein [Patescibacteria group bacterium]|nr:O-antigen ligase family protein [Patescibacteria group bacterium]